VENLFYKRKTEVTIKPKGILKNEYLKTGIAIVLVIALVLGSYFGLGLALGTETPIRVVESGSMCTTFGGCDGFSDVFTQTLHIGDLIFIQKLNAEDYNANYPNSDIIVYENPNLQSNVGTTPIVHRIVAKYQVNGTWYFQTKGDGNGVHWPANVSSSQYDSNMLWNSGQGVPQEHILGKVVMRVPYFGWITLLMRNTSWALPVIVALIMILVIAEFVIPAIKPKKKETTEEQKQTPSGV
jgi:signal peptidase I